MNPVIVPTMSFARRDLKNDPCPQSWEMMKSRTENPAVRTASGTVSHHEIPRLRSIRYQRTMYGTSELTSCQTERAVDGRWKRATTDFQGAAPGRSASSRSAVSVSTARLVGVTSRRYAKSGSSATPPRGYLPRTGPRIDRDLAAAGSWPRPWGADALPPDHRTARGWPRRTEEKADMRKILAIQLLLVPVLALTGYASPRSTSTWPEKGALLYLSRVLYPDPGFPRGGSTTADYLNGRSETNPATSPGGAPAPSLELPACEPVEAQSAKK